MSSCRKDNKGRNLRNGESQRKDGRYSYKYLDPLGQPHFVYSWRLLKSDVMPKGKKPGPSLREMEEEIQASLDEELLTANVNMTVYELVERYIAQKRGVRENTETGYRFIMNILRKEDFGMLRPAFQMAISTEALTGINPTGQGLRQ